VTFCRYCGAPLAPDSLFCSKCGKRLGHVENPRVENLVRKLRLRTPYPYAALLIVFAVAWMWTPGEPPADYSALKWSLNSDRKLDLPAENLFQEGFSLILENTGSHAVKDIPVEVYAFIEPTQPAEIVANFVGQRLLIMEKGKPLPLTVVLTDEVRPGAKRSFSLEGSIMAASPFKVTYEIREEGSEKVLANYVVQR